MKKIVFVGQTASKKLMTDMAKTLSAQGYECSMKMVSQLQNADYDNFDLLIGMEQADLRDMYRICGGDFAEKMCLLTEFIDRQGISVG